MSYSLSHNSPPLKHDPTAQYCFDSERDSPCSEICRSSDKECIIVGLRIIFLTGSMVLRACAGADELETIVRGNAGLISHCYFTGLAIQLQITGPRFLLCSSHGPKADPYRVSNNTQVNGLLQSTCE
jgi:hypothetical protein